MNNKRLIVIFIFATLVGINIAQYIRTEKLSSDLHKLNTVFDTHKALTNEAIGENYVLHTIAGRQIRTLFNLRLRDMSPEIQQKITEERKKYEDLEKKKDEENK